MWLKVLSGFGFRDRALCSKRSGRLREPYHPSFCRGFQEGGPFWDRVFGVQRFGFSV